MTIEAATTKDCDELTETSTRAFDADVAFGAPGPGGPPGYDSPEWHRRALQWGRVFRLVEDGRAVGGAILRPKSEQWVELTRIWLVPEAQGRGLGRAAIAGVEGLYPQARRWTLDTPTWNLRNHAFCARRGYREVRRSAELVYFEKAVAPAE